MTTRVVVQKPEIQELDWEGEWESSRSYVTGDVVYRDGSSYRALIENVNSDPLLDLQSWEFVARKGEKGETGLQGEQGIPGLSQTIEFEFQIPVHEWVGNHGLDAYPSITTIDTLGRKLRGEEEYSSPNTVKVRFFANGQPVALAGKMILN